MYWQRTVSLSYHTNSMSSITLIQWSGRRWCPMSLAATQYNAAKRMGSRRMLLTHSFVDSCTLNWPLSVYTRLHRWWSWCPYWDSQEILSPILGEMFTRKQQSDLLVHLLTRSCGQLTLGVAPRLRRASWPTAGPKGFLAKHTSFSTHDSRLSWVLIGSRGSATESEWIQSLFFISNKH